VTQGPVPLAINREAAGLDSKHQARGRIRPEALTAGQVKNQDATRVGGLTLSRGAWFRRHREGGGRAGLIHGGRNPAESRRGGKS